MNVLKIDFKSKEDVKQYIIWLCDNKLTYHFDDEPKDVVWTTRDVTDKEKDILHSNHIAMWLCCDVWKLIDSDKDLQEKLNLID